MSHGHSSGPSPRTPMDVIPTSRFLPNFFIAAKRMDEHEMDAGVCDEFLAVFTMAGRFIARAH
jgi:hypothetical protein